MYRALLALVIFLASCGARTSPSAVAPSLEVLREADTWTGSLSERAKEAVMAAVYEVLFGSARDAQTRTRASDRELELMHQASRLTAFYSAEERHVRDMAATLAILEGRGLASAKHRVNMYEAFIRARMLSEAAALARQHADLGLEPLPALREAAALVPGAPTVWSIGLDRRELVRRSIDLHAPAQVVIVSHPRCHFSEAASRELRADPVLGEALRRHASYLAPQDEKLYFDELQQWNRAHPGESIALIVRRDEWPMIDSWSTPTFYFLEHGVVTAKVEGWPRGGRRAELIAALRQVGLLP